MDHGECIHVPASLIFKDLRASWCMRGGVRGPRRDHDLTVAVNDGGGGDGSVVLADIDVDEINGDPVVEEPDSSRKRDATYHRDLLSAVTSTQYALPDVVVPPSPSGEQDPKRNKTSVNEVVNG